MNSCFNISRVFRLLAAVAFVLGCAACHDDTPQDTSHLDVTISIPAERFIDSRAMGDPGDYEHFELPNYLYLYLVSTDSEGNQTLLSLEEQLTGTWTKRRLGASYYPTEEDSIYTYNGTFSFDLPANRRVGRVFVAMTSVPFDRIEFGTGATLEEQVMNTTFDLAHRVEGGHDYGFDYIRNIYSSPYNLTNAAGYYYGQIRNYHTAAPTLDMILYHVGAKLDVLWNVPETGTDDLPLQTRLRLSDLEVRNLKSTDCLLFKPMLNTSLGSNPYNEGTSVDAPGTGIINVGNQWYGRHSFYIIPYSVGTDASPYFPLQMQVWKNGDTHATVANGYKPATIQVPVDRDAVFTPWLRGLATISTVFDYN